MLLDDASLALLNAGAIIDVWLEQSFDSVPEVSCLYSARSTRRRASRRCPQLVTLRTRASWPRAGVLFVNRANLPALGPYERFGLVESLHRSRSPGTT